MLTCLTKTRLRQWPVNSLGLGCAFLLSTIAAAAQTPQSAAVLPGTRPADFQTPGTIVGKVVDQSGANVTGADVKLTREDDSTSQDVQSDENGRFTFAKVAPGAFHIAVSSGGLAPQQISGTLHPGEAYAIPDVKLVVATQMTEVRVAMTQEEIAEEQLKDEEKQRVFGLIPNFYVTYDKNAVPLNTRQKFRLAWKSSVDPITFLGVGALAGLGQAGNRWRGYGQGAEGYAKRYGAEYGNVFTGTYIGGAILPSILKQDPRYFYKGTGSKRSRLLYAIGSQFVAKGDNGKWQPNYSNLGGDIASGALSNLYYPASSHHGANLVFSTALVRLGETTAAAIFQEFFVPRLTPNLPTRAPTQQ